MSLLGNTQNQLGIHNHIARPRKVWYSGQTPGLSLAVQSILRLGTTNHRQTTWL